MKDFAKKLELYFRSFPTHERLYYERRSHQYDDQDIPKVRIIVHHNLIRAMGAVFLGLPHITTRTFRRLSAKVGEDMFVDTDKPDPYYVAALALFRLEQLFNAKKVDARYKPARYQILLAARLLIDNQPLPRMNSTEMEKRCKEMSRRLWDDDKIESLFSQAIQVVERIAGDDWDRDSIRTEPVTRAIFEEVSLQASQG